MKRRISENSSHGAVGNEGKRARSSTGGALSNSCAEKQNGTGLVSVSLHFTLPRGKKAELMSQFGKYVVGSNGTAALNGTASSPMNGAKKPVGASRGSPPDSSSSSDSDSAPKTGSAIRPQTIKIAAKASVAKAPSESSDSDSDAEVVAKPKPAVPQTSTAHSTKPLARAADPDSSDSDSDSETGKPPLPKRGMAVNGTGPKALKSVAEQGAKGQMNKQPTSDSSSESSDSKRETGTKQPIKPMVSKTSPQKSSGKLPAKSQQSSDSESDSETEMLPKAKGTMPVPKSAVAAKKPSGQKAVVPSSDSESSDAEKAPPKPTAVRNLQKTGVMKTKAPPSSTDSDSSDSESKPHSALVAAKTNAPSPLKSATASLKKPSLPVGKVSQADSSDSDSEGEPAVKAPVAKKSQTKTTPVIAGTGKKVSMGSGVTKPGHGKAAPKAPAASSSDSDSEDEKVAVNKAVTASVKKSATAAASPLVKGPGAKVQPALAAKKQRTTSSSTDSSSSDSDNASPTAAESKIQTPPSKGPKPAGGQQVKSRLSEAVKKPSNAKTSSSGDEDEEVKAKGKKSLNSPIVAPKSTPKGAAKVLSGKKGAPPSSSSSDSDSDASEAAEVPASLKTPPSAVKKLAALTQTKDVESGKAKGPARKSSSSDSSSDEEAAKNKSKVKGGGVATASPGKPKAEGKKQKAPSSDSSSGSDDDDNSPAGNRVAKATKRESASPQKQLPRSAPRPGATQPPQTRSRTRSSGSEPDGPAKHDLRSQAQNQRRSEPFRRVTVSREQLDPKFRNNQYQKDNDTGGWGREASDRFSHVKGKNFRHEMTKAKRGSYPGGKITQDVKSIKFND